MHDHDHLVTEIRCMDLPDSDRGDFSCRRAVDSSSLLSGVPDYFGRNKISSGGDLSHYSSASLY